MPIRAEGSQAVGEATHECFHLFLADAGKVPCHHSKRPGGMGLTPGEGQHEHGEAGEQHDAHDSDCDIGAVEAVQGNGDHKGDPQHAVQHYCRADPLGRQGEAGIGSVDAVGSEQPVAEAGAAGVPPGMTWLTASVDRSIRSTLEKGGPSGGRTDLVSRP